MLITKVEFILTDLSDNPENSTEHLAKKSRSDAPITQSLIGILEKSTLNEIDYKRHLEKKHL